MKRTAMGLVACGLALGISYSVIGGTAYAEGPTPAVRTTAVPARQSPAVAAAALDPRVVAQITDLAETTFGSRYASTWVANNQTTVVVGVVNPTQADRWWAAHQSVPVQIVGCPVSGSVLDAAFSAAQRAAGTSLVSAAPDYVNGRVGLEVDAGDVAATVAQIDAVSTLAATTSATPPLSTTGKVIVVVSAGAESTALETLDPPQSNTTGPLMAGKAIDISVNDDVYSACTSNVEVQSGSANYMLTAGHCGPVGKAVSFGNGGAGVITQSTWGSSQLGSSIAGDVALFGPVPADTQPVVFQSPTSALPVSDSSDPTVGQQVCTRGRTTNQEVCGPVTAVGVSIRDRDGDDTSNWRTLTGMVQASIPSQPGDSGSPVYAVVDGTAVVLGILASNSPNGAISCFTPIATAMDLTGTTLVTAAGYPTPPVVEILPEPIDSPTPTQPTTPAEPTTPTTPAQPTSAPAPATTPTPTKVPTPSTTLTIPILPSTEAPSSSSPTPSQSTTPTGEPTPSVTTTSQAPVAPKVLTAPRPNSAVAPGGSSSSLPADQTSSDDPTGNGGTAGGADPSQDTPAASDPGAGTPTPPLAGQSSDGSAPGLTAYTGGSTTLPTGGIALAGLLVLVGCGLGLASRRVRK